MEKKYILTRGIWWLKAHFVAVGVLLVLLLITANRQNAIMRIVLIGLAVEHVALIIVMYRAVILPIKSTNKVYQAFSRGYGTYDVFEQPYELSKEHALMMRQMKELLGEKDLAELYQSQAEYMALQNQINPHFLYNTLEGIRSEALIGGLPMVGEMTETLARFFRYTISNLRSMVTVEDELLNIRHYCTIQRFRMGEKISYEVIFDEGQEQLIKALCMPKLILQPIVENAIRHGIEPIIGQGLISIRFQLLASRLMIVISDNGVGMNEEQLEELNEKMKITRQQRDDALQEKGGIAIGNVNSRIKLLFGQDYGLRFYSKEGHGTDVEISLPVIKEQKEKAGEINE